MLREALELAVNALEKLDESQSTVKQAFSLWDKLEDRLEENLKNK